jgi:hypothetical protein
VDADDGAAILVDPGDSVAAVTREPGELDVPVGRLDVLVPARLQSVAADPDELAAVVGQVVKPLRVGIERGDSVLSGGLVGREMGHRARPDIPQIDVAVGCAPLLQQRDPSAVARDARDHMARLLFVDEGPLEPIALVAIEIEETPVALVGQHVQGHIVARPAGEHCLEP